MASPNDIEKYCRETAAAARAASRLLAVSSGAARSRALRTLADLLIAESSSILAANSEDCAAAEAARISAAMLDRLRLDEKRLHGMAEGVREVAAMPDPVGEVISGGVRPNGLDVRKIRVPLGVAFFIYESRPNVTTDAAALCIKSGNAVILRGGSEAKRSNQSLANVVSRSLEAAGLPTEAVVAVNTTDRAAVDHFLQDDRNIDLAIPRGGEALIRRVAAGAKMPVLKHYQGVCHVYLDESADAEMAAAIIENSKCQRPGVCNAAECLLVHAAAAPRLLPTIAARLTERRVELRGCPESCRLAIECIPADEEDYGREFLDLILAVRVVPDLEAACSHIARYGSGHTETIVTRDLAAARRFTAMVDSACVLVNASTRFNDGGELGLGAEIGISTNKFHARGPCGLRELTSYKYVVFGDGQIRT